MADLDQISAMIGGLQVDVRRLVEWTATHEIADQRRFEDLANRIESRSDRQGDRVTALELSRAEMRGGWKFVSIIGAVAGGVGAFLYHLLGMKL